MEYLAGAGKFDAAFEIMSKMLEAGIPPDKATCNILVQKCSVARNTSAIAHVLQYMKDSSIVLRRPIFLEALEAFKDSGKINHLLREVNPHLAFEGIEEEIDSRMNSDNILYTIDRELVINLLAKKNFIAIERILNDKINNEIQLDSGLMSSVVQAYCANSRLSGALLAFQYCLRTDKKLDRCAYISLIGLLIRANSLSNVMEIVEEIVQAGIDLGSYLVSILIHQLGCAGLSSIAAKIFHSSLSDQNTVTYTSLMSAYFQAGEVDKGLEIYSKMRSQGITMSHGTYAVLITGLEEAGRISDAEIYRKEKRSLQWRNNSIENLSAEESLCNCLFNGI
ncbi:uncharacterized protein A4U43_C08F11780 [Asparagus officinalis]|nr:uncharacterized protein A4U43_C08F11780 [Asparagus officinalis]